MLEVIFMREKKGMHFTFMFLLSSDKASKIMALTATSPSPQILFVYIPAFNLFSVWVSLLQCEYSLPA